MTPVAIRDSYGTFVFDTLLGAYRVPSQTNLPLESLIYSAYFSASSLDLAPRYDSASLNDWVGTLWDVRKDLGEDFANRALMFSLNAPVEYSEDLNKHFRERFQGGVLVVKNKFDDFMAVNKILERHSLLR
jgi:hypothetical protein